MATRSRIGIVNLDGTIDSVYCHFDGYLDGVGDTLLTFYNNETSIHELLSYGDMSGLHDTIEATVFYGLDRSETGVDMKTSKNMDDFSAICEEYNYLFVMGKWTVFGNDGENWEKLDETLQKNS
jgi:hypothetical protein